MDGLTEIRELLSDIDARITRLESRMNCGAEMAAPEPNKAVNPFTKLVDETMEQFDFGRVQRVMKLLDWKWASSKTEEKIPTTKEIKAEALGMLHSVTDYLVNEMKYDKDGTKSFQISTGGFKAMASEEKFGKYRYLSLSFEVEEYTAEGEETDEQDF